MWQVHTFNLEYNIYVGWIQWARLESAKLTTVNRGFPTLQNINKPNFVRFCIAPVMWDGPEGVTWSFVSSGAFHLPPQLHLYKSMTYLRRAWKSTIAPSFVYFAFIIYMLCYIDAVVTGLMMGLTTLALFINVSFLTTSYINTQVNYLPKCLTQPYFPYHRPTSNSKPIKCTSSEVCANGMNSKVSTMVIDEHRDGLDKGPNFLLFAAWNPSGIISKSIHIYNRIGGSTNIASP